MEFPSLRIKRTCEGFSRNNFFLVDIHIKQTNSIRCVAQGKRILILCKSIFMLIRKLIKNGWIPRAGCDESGLRPLIFLLLLMRAPLSVFENHMSPACERALKFFLLGVQRRRYIRTYIRRIRNWRAADFCCIHIDAHFPWKALSARSAFRDRCSNMRCSHRTAARTRNVIHFPFSPRMLCSKEAAAHFSVPASAFSVRSQGVFIFPRRDVSHWLAKASLAPGRRDIMAHRMHYFCAFPSTT